MSENPNYKDTLQLPKTDFPMKGNLPQQEPKRIASWQNNRTYEKMLSGRKDKFVFQDGPPYANGNIHMGHALNKILKDMIVKYKNMAGRSAAFIPGWDCHGLPIELEVNKKLGSKRKDISDNDFRNQCREYAKKWIATQKEQFQRLGILADWDNPYLTLSKEYEAEEVRQLAKIVEKGSFYRGDKPVYWCWPLQTALADTEVEYAEHESPAIYVKFEITKGLELDKKAYVVIWTTTPWTIPANLAIALNKDFDYSLFEHENEYLLFADGLQEQIEELSGLKFKKVEGSTKKGSELTDLECQHPWIQRKSVILLGDHVTLEAGTGAVHTAPGHGPDDYILGLKHDLPAYSPVDEAGCFTDEVPEFRGENVFKANPLIVEKLNSSGHLLAHYKLKHSYPHCWRTKKPLIFRATSQWFLRMDDDTNELRKKTLAAIKKVKWIPAWGENRINAMIENRPDWCLSRQRLWGVPIPVFKCKSCGEHLVSSEVMLRVADKMEKEDGINSYFESDASEFTNGLPCPSCGNDEFEKSKDILDVWFDSGVSHAAVQRHRPELADVADLYLEGSDQHRGWFQTSLLTSIAAYDQAPYKQVLTHGFVNDLKGRKMSKSLGNVVDPNKVIEKYGAEILRLWASYEDYSQDVTCGDESFKRLSETYRRMRNTVRFLLGNLFDFDINKDAVNFQDMLELDRWALIRLNQLTNDVTQHYERYEFYKIYHAINNFVTVDLSARYLDVLKDRLYTDKKSGLSRRSAQTVVYHLCDRLCLLMAPILSFLAEETYAYLRPDIESIFTCHMPKVNPEWQEDALIEKFDHLMQVRSEVSKILEDLRRSKEIGSSLEAKVILYAKGKTFDYLQSYEAELPTFFIVSQVELKEGELKVEATKADGEKCVRCWQYSTAIGSDKNYPGICLRCTEALK